MCAENTRRRRRIERRHERDDQRQYAGRERGGLPDADATSAAGVAPERAHTGAVDPGEDGYGDDDLGFERPLRRELAGLTVENGCLAKQLSC